MLKGEGFKVEPYNGLVIFSTAALATVHIFIIGYNNKLYDKKRVYFG